MSKKNKRLQLYILSFLCVLAGVALDQFTKYLAVVHLKERTIPFIKDVFELQYLENRGAAFGILQNQQTFFLVIGSVMVILITLLFMRLPLNARMIPLRVCLIAIVAGAIGNMIDRVRLNYVIDFLYFKLIDFPIFNVADIFVTMATIGLAVLILFYYKDAEIDQIGRMCLGKKEAKQEQTDEA